MNRFGLDTNILVYAHEPVDGKHQERAREVVSVAARSGRGVLALQSIGEFFAVTTRKRHLTREAATDLGHSYLRTFQIACADESDAVRALKAASQSTHSYWDALLLATLSRHGCGMLLSEDMADGSTFDGLTIRNPLGGERLAEDIEALLHN